MTFVKLEVAVKAIEAERLAEDTGTEADAGYMAGLDDAIAALRSLPTDDGWEDIATAPKDGTAFLAYWPQAYEAEHSPYAEAPTATECPMVTRWFEYDGGDGYWGPIDGDVCHYAPTHWRPLPAPPSE